MVKRIVAVLAGTLFLALLTITPPNVRAQSAPSGRTVAVIPPSFELFANPGDSVNDKLRVRNDTDATTAYTISVDDFKATGEDGSVDIIDDQSNTSYSLAKWVYPEPKSFTLGAKEEREIPFTINVPKNAEPGGHYGSILVKMGGDADVKGGSGATVSSRVGSLILLRVSGNIREDASIESFAASKKYYQGSPVDFELRTKNNGNNHIKPKGTIIITNVFGKKVAEIPLNGLNILPGAIRKMPNQWKFSSLMASRYTATVVATYGQQNRPLSASTSFVVFPRALAFVVGGFILFLIVLLGSKRRIRRILHNLTR